MELYVRIWRVSLRCAVAAAAYDRSVKLLASFVVAVADHQFGFEWYQQRNGVRALTVFLSRWYWERKRQVVLI